MLTKQERELKRQTLVDCRLNGVTVSQELIRNKTYAGWQALVVERWIARQRTPWGGYVIAVVGIVCGLAGTVLRALLQNALG